MQQNIQMVRLDNEQGTYEHSSFIHSFEIDFPFVCGRWLDIYRENQFSFTKQNFKHNETQLKRETMFIVYM